jgi:hypothetical protein
MRTRWRPGSWRRRRAGRPGARLGRAEGVPDGRPAPRIPAGARQAPTDAAGPAAGKSRPRVPVRREPIARRGRGPPPSERVGTQLRSLEAPGRLIDWVWTPSRRCSAPGPRRSRHRCGISSCSRTSRGRAKNAAWKGGTSAPVRCSHGCPSYDGRRYVAPLSGRHRSRWDLVRAGVPSAARSRPRLPFSRRQSLRSVGRAAELRGQAASRTSGLFPPICFAPSVSFYGFP